MADNLPPDLPPFAPPDAEPPQASGRVVQMRGRKRKTSTRPSPKAGAWQKGLVLDRDGNPARGIANVMHVLANHPSWDGVLCYDAFTETIAKQLPPPVRPQDGRSEVGEWTEHDTTRTAAWFASEIGVEPATGHIEQAVAATAELRTVHPVREYLASLEWDGTPRLDSLLVDYFGSADGDYVRSVGARWVISAVARIMRPGCQADCMLVLEGQQGAGKSTGLEALASPELFADTGISIGDKDSYQALRGKWIYEFGELDALKGRDVTRIKNFVSARVDTYRPSYGRRTRDFKRQIIFAGTTNEAEYLRDSTGNRRFWPIRCGRIDVAAIRRDRDELWAEAMTRYQAGEPWHVDTPELRRLCEEAQAERQHEDAWLSIIASWLRHQRTGGSLDPVTIPQVMTGALEMRPSDMRHDLVTRAGHVLRSLGWTPRQRRINGERVRVYHPPTTGEEG